MNRRSRYAYEVELDGRSVRVVATDRVAASHRAAYAMGVAWLESARRMEIRRGEVVEDDIPRACADEGMV